MSDDIKYIVSLVAVLAVIMGLAATVWIIKSWQEAEAYNRLTGKSVTTWDAMFLELRIQEQADNG